MVAYHNRDIEPTRCLVVYERDRTNRSEDMSKEIVSAGPPPLMLNVYLQQSQRNSLEAATCVLGAAS